MSTLFLPPGNTRFVYRNLLSCLWATFQWVKFHPHPMDTDYPWIFSGNAGPLYLEPLRSQMISDLSWKLQLWDPNCLKVRETVNKLQVQDRGMFVSCAKESLRRLKWVLPDSPSLMILPPSILLGITSERIQRWRSPSPTRAMRCLPDHKIPSLGNCGWCFGMALSTYVCIYIYTGILYTYIYNNIYII